MNRRTPQIGQPGRKKPTRPAPKVAANSEKLSAVRAKGESDDRPRLKPPGKRKSTSKRPEIRVQRTDQTSRKTKTRRRPDPLEERGKTLFSRLFWGLFRLGLILAVWAGIAGIGLAAYIAADLPDIRKQNVLERRPSLTILAADDTPLVRYGDFHTNTIDAQDLPPHLVQAVLAVEDRRFYDHFGVDVIGLARAMWINYQAGRVIQGGSTLTQQLAKNLFLTPERTLKRKAQEAILALWLEQRYSKNQLLTAYLNRVYLGAGTYGVDAAARTYFDKSARDVTLGEAAILAGLLKAPSRYSPASAPDLAWQRAQTVLGAMLDAGFITEKERQNLETNNRPAAIPTPNDSRRYFADWIATQVTGYLGSIDRDLVIRTSFDERIQLLAERALVETVNANRIKNRITQGASIVMQLDGTVLAMVGGLDYDTSQFNRAADSLRQPGSSFKPIVYLAAMEKGLRPDSPVEDAPISIRGWKPENYTNKYEGVVSLTTALTKSLNTASVRVMEYAGIDNVRNLARRLGITRPLGRDLSLALGTSEISMLEMAGAYGVFANGGRAITPHGIREIRDSEGRLLYQYQAQANAPQVVDGYLNAALVGMMRNVVEHGTGTAARLEGREVAGKTGTSQNYRDAWFIGFTGNLLGAVWVGNDNNQPMNKVTGGAIPAKIWANIMAPTLADQPVVPLPNVADFVPVTTAETSIEPETSAEPSETQNSDFDRFLDNLLGSDNKKTEETEYPNEYIDQQ